MRLRFKSMLAFIFVLILICCTLGIGYIFYEKIDNEADIVVDGELTINYLNGKKFKLNGDNTLAFSVTNNDTETKYYYIQFKDVYATDVTYELESSDNLKISKDLKSEIVSNQISINGNETINYKLTLKGKDSYKGVIQIGLKENEENTFSDVILKNNTVSEVSLTELGAESNLDEGLIKKEDDYGVSYYFRGNVKNNNVEFANLNWRIVKINGDGSVKLVLNDLIEDLSKYYDTNYEFSKSKISEVLDNWYKNNLSDYSDYIAYYKFCNDYVTDEKDTLAYNRVLVNKIPSFICLGTSVNSRIGLLTIDEVSLAGASLKANKEYYLYNENIKNPYYTMSSYSIKNDVYNAFIVLEDGSIGNVNGTLLRGVRPVINIIKTAKVSGNGSIDTPYKIN